MPHVAIFLNNLEGGGAEHVMVSLANSFVDRGIRVDMVVANSRGPNKARLDQRIKVVDFQKSSTYHALPALTRYLVENRPDALLSALTHVNNLALLANLLSRTKTRIVVSERISLRWRPRNIRERLHAVLRPVFYRLADKIVMVSRQELDLAAQRFRVKRENIVGIYNPVITSEFDSLRRQEPDHPWLQPDYEPTVPKIVAVGRLSYQKGFDVLLDAFSILRQQRKAKLIIFGKGELQMQLEQKSAVLGIDGDVSFPGFVENPLKEVEAADLFVLSSRFEGLPGVLIQALACGVPIVSTDCYTGPREILDGGKWGQLVPCDDTDRLAAALLQKIDAGIQNVAEEHLRQFSDATVVDEYLSVLIPQ